MNPITLNLTSTSLTAAGGPVTLTASVTNSATVPARVVLGAFPPASAAAGPPPAPGASPGASSDAVAWTSVERPLRGIVPGATEQYTVTFTPPPDTAAGQYVVRLIAYDADRPPEEYSDQAQHVELVVPARPGAAPSGVPWWVYLVAGVLVVLVGVVAFLVLRPGGGAEPTTSPPSPPAETTPPTSAPPTPTTTNPCPPPYVPRLARDTDLTCVTALSAAEAKADNDPALQALRKDPTGPYGPETCVQGYVWREAFEGDVVCVTGNVRTRTYWENQGFPEGHP